MDDVKGPDTPECFEKLVAEYQTQLRRLCCVLLKDIHLAEDAVQETFLKAYRSMGEFRNDSSERTWLTRIAVNTCRDLMRSRWFRQIDRSVKIEDLPEPAAPADPEDTGLYETILRLPVKQSTVLPAQDPDGGEAPVIVVSQMEPDGLNSLVLEMKEGEAFTVLDANKLNNTMYMCGGLGEGFRDTSMALNRLVDPAAVKCIRADGTTYLPEE